MDLVWKDEHLTLCAEKALFLQQYRTLVIADLHLGKVNHFRKAGIAVPVQANHQNAEIVIQLIQSYKPTRLIFLGDLFHSHYNDEWEVFGQLRRHFSACRFDLVIGNHDILSRHQYDRHEISVCPQLTLGSFIFTHDPNEAVPAELYQVSGHLHPGARLRGSGKQSLTLPCFWMGARQMILPAFGSFTGLARIKPKKGDRLFVVTHSEVIEIVEKEKQMLSE
jgi:DNA ligase-associated metallophosphoesterase